MSQTDNRPVKTFNADSLAVRIHASEANMAADAARAVREGVSVLLVGDEAIDSFRDQAAYLHPLLPFSPSHPLEGMTELHEPSPH